MKRQVVVLGAGFGGLELSTLLSERLTGQVEVTLIDQNDAFTLGFSKLDIVFRIKHAMRFGCRIGVWHSEMSGSGRRRFSPSTRNNVGSRRLRRPTTRTSWS